jgi:hypothetical protein
MSVAAPRVKHGNAAWWCSSAQHEQHHFTSRNDNLTFRRSDRGDASGSRPRLGLDLRTWSRRRDGERQPLGGCAERRGGEPLCHLWSHRRGLWWIRRRRRPLSIDALACVGAPCAAFRRPTALRRSPGRPAEHHAQSIITMKRLRKPTRYQRCTASHPRQAMKRLDPRAQLNRQRRLGLSVPLCVVHPRRTSVRLRAPR